ncbi:MAG TPA: cobalamin-binding protein [Thermaerobacter sp.]
MRIVSIAPSNTEIAFALGLGPHVVGVDDHSDYPPEVARLPRVGPDLQVDLDRVEALRPDLVLASLSVPGMERNVEELRRRGIPHIVLDPRSWQDVLDSIRQVGAATGREAEAHSLVMQLEERAERVRRRMARVAGARGRPWRLFLEWWPKPLITPGRLSWFTDMAELVGGQNIFADVAATSTPVTPDEVLARDPDAVLVCWCGSLQSWMNREQVLARPGWAAMGAAREGRIYPVPEDLFGRPGPRLIAAVEMLAELLDGPPETALRRAGLAWPRRGGRPSRPGEEPPSP